MLFLLLFVAPGLVALMAEYLACRLPKKRFWRAVPPVVLVLGAAIALWSRIQNWGEGPVPMETLLFFPGLPALGLLCGCALGYRLWKKIWTPRIK